MMYADLDTNRDGVIERNEWRGTPNSFRLHDWNGDGVLSGDEVRSDAFPPANSRQANDYSMPNSDRFSYLDVNNNGTIDRSEWDGSLDAFYRLDRNNDGRLSRAEFSSVQSSSPFAAIDTNRDGRISLGEWPYSHRSFDQQDVNGDGVITPNEFRGVPASTTGR
jgi:Ca2+-binding EF-hand superfamily protein